MRARAIALVTASAMAATPLVVAVTGASAATTPPPKAGHACKKGKTPPAGFLCKKNAKGKYVLVKKSTKSKSMKK